MDHQELTIGRLRIESQQDGDAYYHADEIFKIARLQARVRKFIQHKRAIKQYLDACSSQEPDSTQAQTDLVQQALKKYGPFVYANESEELDMNFGPREIRPMKLMSNGEIYIGEWLVGKEDVREGRGMSIWKDGSLFEGYYKNGLGC